MCFVWIWEQTAIISLYSINWLVCITETECLLRGTNWVFKSDIYTFVLKGLKYYRLFSETAVYVPIYDTIVQGRGLLYI